MPIYRLKIWFIAPGEDGEPARFWDERSLVAPAGFDAEHRHAVGIHRAAQLMSGFTADMEATGTPVEVERWQLIDRETEEIVIGA